MAVWKELNDDELYFIMECEKLKHVVNAFDHKISQNKWIKDAREYYEASFDTSMISQSIFSSLNDAMSYAPMTLLAIIGTVTVKLLALTFLTVGFTALMLLIGVIFFAASYDEQRDEMNKARKFFDFATIKIECAKELVYRQEMRLKTNGINHKPQPFDHATELRPFSYKNKSRIQKIKPALGAGSLTFTMLFGTYYLGLTAILSAFGATAATAILQGPLGMGIALGVAALLGIYCGYKQYRSTIAMEKIEKHQKHLGEEFRHLRNKAFSLDKTIQNSIGNNASEKNTIHRSFSDPNLSCQKDLYTTSSAQHDFLMRRANLYRHRKPAKVLPNDPIIPSPANNNNFPTSGRPTNGHFRP